MLPVTLRLVLTAEAQEFAEEHFLIKIALLGVLRVSAV
jgi:hypothetical protein